MRNMALRNQPYIPLYVQDYLTDEKLNMCSLSTQGVYIKIMCIMHKQSEYGVILLKQKDKQNESKCLNFACKIAKLLPIQINSIESAINELVDEGVLEIDGDKLIQKRMVKDNDVSEKRSAAGSKGGKKTQSKEDFAKAKNKVNTEYEDEYENVPSFEEFKEHALLKLPNVDIADLKLKYDSWVDNKWKDGNDKKIKNWKSKLTNTLRFIKTVSKSEISENDFKIKKY